MKDRERQIRVRKNWLKVYSELGSVSKAGVARSAMHRWIQRHNEEGESGLSDKSKRSKTLSNTKVSEEIEALILDIRNKRRWGAQRISTEQDVSFHGRICVSIRHGQRYCFNS